MLKGRGVIPRSVGDEESASHNLLIWCNSRFLAALGMTQFCMAASISGRIDRFDDKATKDFTRMLLSAAANLSERLGGSELPR